jgi:hypothetical protein
MNTELLESLATMCKHLANGVKELVDLRNDAITSGSSEAFARLGLAAEQLRKIKEQYLLAETQARTPLTILPDGRALSLLQCAALGHFAANNNLTIESLLDGVVIDGNVVVECYFSNHGLRTLEGLQRIGSIKKLSVTDNCALTSLKGIPNQKIEEIVAVDCGLTGDHTFLSQAPKLRELLLELNPTSLTLDISEFRPGVVRR